MVLLNNDALLTRTALVAMQQQAYQDLNIGLVVPRQVLFLPIPGYTMYRLPI